jgi:hypothetical protein
VKDWKELRFPKIGRSGRLSPDNQKLFTEQPIERSVAGGLTEASSVKINRKKQSNGQPEDFAVTGNF